MKVSLTVLLLGITSFGKLQKIQIEQQKIIIYVFKIFTSICLFLLVVRAQEEQQIIFGLTGADILKTTVETNENSNGNNDLVRFFVFI